MILINDISAECVYRATADLRRAGETHRYVCLVTSQKVIVDDTHTPAADTQSDAHLLNHFMFIGVRSSFHFCWRRNELWWHEQRNELQEILYSACVFKCTRPAILMRTRVIFTPRKDRGVKERSFWPFVILGCFWLWRGLRIVTKAEVKYVCWACLALSLCLTTNW